MSEVEQEPVAPPVGKSDSDLLVEIRDLLAAILAAAERNQGGSHVLLTPQGDVRPVT